MKNCLIFGATGGIGRAFVTHLRQNPSTDTVNVVSRSTHGLDFTNPETIAQTVQSLDIPEGGFDLIINAIGVLEVDGVRPEKALSEIDPETMQKIFAINAMGPALLFKHFAQFLTKDKASVFAHLSARIGSIGDNRLGGWISYRASKAALNQIIKTASIELKRNRPKSICVAIHPGTIETALTRKYAAGRYTATPDQAAEAILRVLENLTPKDTGCFFDYTGNRIEW